MTSSHTYVFLLLPPTPPIPLTFYCPEDMLELGIWRMPYQGHISFAVGHFPDFSHFYPSCLMTFSAGIVGHFWLFNVTEISGKIKGFWTKSHSILQICRARAPTCLSCQHSTCSLFKFFPVFFGHCRSKFFQTGSVQIFTGHSILLQGLYFCFHSITSWCCFSLQFYFNFKSKESSSKKMPNFLSWRKVSPI